MSIVYTLQGLQELFHRYLISCSQHHGVYFSIPAVGAAGLFRVQIQLWGQRACLGCRSSPNHRAPCTSFLGCSACTAKGPPQCFPPQSIAMADVASETRAQMQDTPTQPGRPRIADQTSARRQRPSSARTLFCLSAGKNKPSPPCKLRATSASEDAVPQQESQSSPQAPARVRRSTQRKLFGNVPAHAVTPQWVAVQQQVSHGCPRVLQPCCPVCSLNPAHLILYPEWNLAAKVHVH